MSIEKVMEILSTFEVQAQSEIKLDQAINIDPYESIGKFKLIKNIQKRIINEIDINDDKEAA